MNLDDFYTDPNTFLCAQYEDSYIGGWTAAAYHGLQDELAHGVFMFSPHIQEKKIEVVEGMSVELFPVHPKWANVGIITVPGYIGDCQMSDIHRTVLDGLLLPESVGGQAMAEHIFYEYMNSSDADFQKMISYAKKNQENKLILPILLRLKKEVAND